MTDICSKGKVQIKGTNKRRLDLRVIQFESYVDQILKDMVMKRIKSKSNKIRVIKMLSVFFLEQM